MKGLLSSLAMWTTYSKLSGSTSNSITQEGRTSAKADCNTHVKENEERWMELARLASTEQNPDKLTALIAELIQLLDQKADGHKFRPDIPPDAPVKD